MIGFPTLQLTALAILLAAAVYWDLRQQRIPNAVTVPGLVAGLLLGWWAEGGFPGYAFAGAGVALLVSFPLVVFRMVGAGDAKLLTAVGAFVGVGGLLPVLVYAGLAGGVLAVTASLKRGALLGVLVNAKNLMVYWVTMGRGGQQVSLDGPNAHSIPYGVAIAAGALFAWFYPFSLGG